MTEFCEAHNGDGYARCKCNRRQSKPAASLDWTISLLRGRISNIRKEISRHEEQIKYRQTDIENARKTFDRISNQQTKTIDGHNDEINAQNRYLDDALLALDILQTNAVVRSQDND